jgi:hypothetical protein
VTIFGRQPVAWVGIIAAFVIAIIQTANGQGLISDAIAGRAIDLTNSLVPVLLTLVPLAMSVFLHPAVTPVAAPALPSGTTVTVITPGDAPNTTTVLPGPPADPAPVPPVVPTKPNVAGG